MSSRYFGLDRFKKAQATEPFQVDEIRRKAQNGAVGKNSTSSTRLEQTKTSQQASLASSAGQENALGAASISYLPNVPSSQALLAGSSVQDRRGGAAVPSSPSVPSASLATNPHATTVGEGASTWQAPDWAVEPRAGVYHLEVSKDGQVVDRIPLDKKRTIFGRQQATCDYVLEHPSLSRQHAAVVHHRNGSVFVIDLGSVHGTFVSNERLTKDIPVEIEPGQSVRFAASSRSYILHKTAPPPQPPTESNEATFTGGRQANDAQIPPPPDPANADAVLEYNTLMNRLGFPVTASSGEKGAAGSGSSSQKRKRKEEDGASTGQRNKVRFRDEQGGILVEVVGFSDGYGVSTEPGPVGVREGGSLVGKFDSLVQTVLIPKVKSKNTAAALADTPARPTDSVNGEGKEVKGRFPSSSAEQGSHRDRGMSDKLKDYLGRALAKSGGLYGGLGEASPSGSHLSWGKSEGVDKSAPGKVEDVLGGKSKSEPLNNLFGSE